MSIGSFRFSRSTSLSSDTSAPERNFDSKSADGYFTNRNGFKISCKYWNHQNKSPASLVFLSHSAGQHCQYYNELAEQLCTKNLFVFSHDHQGHGQSEGPRVDITDFRHYTRDVFYHIEMVQKRFPSAPGFIIGHSMGATVCVLAGLQSPELFTGMVLISPAVIKEQVGPFTRVLGKLFSKILPQLTVNRVTEDNLSRDKEVCQVLKDDPLTYHGGLKARWTSCFMNTLEEIQDDLYKIDWPILVVHGDNDRIVNLKGSELLHKHAASQDKTLKIYRGCYLEPHLSIDKVSIKCRDDIVDWVVKRLPGEKMVNLLP